MAQMKIATLQTGLVAGCAVMVATVGAVGMWGTDQNHDALKTVYEDRLIPVTQLTFIDGRMFRNRVELTLAAANPAPERTAQAIQAVEANIAAITKAWDAYMATYLTAEEKGLSQQFLAARSSFVKEGLRPTIEALKAGDADKARQLTVETLPRLHVAASTHLEALVALQVKVANDEYTAATARERMAALAILGASLGGLLLAALYGFWVTRRITRALGAEPQALREVTDAVARGDLSVDIVARHGAEDSVMAGLKRMTSQLSQSVSGVRSNADQVANASTQIAQGNSNLSGRTEQQAAALQETAASMEQLGTTVRQNADNARQANQLAMSASTVAVQGGDVVAQVVDTMKGINDSSKKIADIIAVIDGIAFQTNILALNAAVEAARAGEVRSLAQRSAEAAKEIKGLITASVDRVGQGTELVDRAGQTMQEVVAAIKRVTDIMGEISAASVEQSAGVAQVGQAITQMDQATQQNAALVEESAAAADSLRSQAQALLEAVSAFRLAGAGQADASAGWVAQERRGPNRATNVTRPAFGQAKPAAPAAAVAAPVVASAVAAPAAVATATGTDDDWATF